MTRRPRRRLGCSRRGSRGNVVRRQRLCRRRHCCHRRRRRRRRRRRPRRPRRRRRRRHTPSFSYSSFFIFDFAGVTVYFVVVLYFWTRQVVSAGNLARLLIFVNAPSLK
jgi:hypothetical protein